MLLLQPRQPLVRLLRRRLSLATQTLPADVNLRVTRLGQAACTISTGMRLCVRPRFERLEPHGVGFERTAWRGAGGACCSLVVRRVPAG